MAFIYCTTERGAIIVGVAWTLISIFIIIVSGSLSYYEAIKVSISENGTLSEDTLPILIGFYYKTAKSENDNTTTLTNYNNEELVEAYIRITYNLMYSLFGLFTFIVSHELLAGIRDKNFWRCGTWLRWQLGSLLFKILTYPVEIILFTKGAPLALPLSITLVGWILNLYCMHVVIKFMNELKIDAVAPDGHTTTKPHTDNTLRYRRTSQGTIMLSCGIRRMPGHV